MKNITFLGGLLATSLTVLLGILLLFPGLFQNNLTEVLLVFEIVNGYPDWCSNLSKILSSDSTKTTVFINGELASRNPSCVTTFEENTDIGSQTYSFIELPSVVDYSLQKQEVELGKKTIDEIGNIDSKIFRAPGMKTDDNIYSLLQQNDIEFDLSYSDHYNKFQDGLFLRFDLIPLDWRDIAKTDFSKFKKETPVLILMNDSNSINNIEQVLKELKEKNIKFVNASDLMKKELTNRS